jgi:hypothetical protein
MSASPTRTPRHGRSGVLLALAAAAAMVLAFSGCEDDSPAGGTPGQGSQVGGGGRNGGDDLTSGGDSTPGEGSEVGGGGTEVDDLTGGGDGTGTVLPRNTSPGATDAPNPNAGGGGTGTGTSAP